MASFVVFLGLIGCATPQTPYQAYLAGVPMRDIPFKEGASNDTMAGDRIDCEIEATQRVPPNIVLTTTPTRSTPVQSTCNQIGTQTFCTSTGGRTYGGRTSSSDANDDLRVRAYGQCLVNKNYVFYTIPACSQSETRLDAFCYKVSPSGEITTGGG
jgi:hypothetical protein